PPVLEPIAPNVGVLPRGPAFDHHGQARERQRALLLSRDRDEPLVIERHRLGAKLGERAPWIARRLRERALKRALERLARRGRPRGTALANFGVGIANRDDARAVLASNFEDLPPDLLVRDGVLGLAPVAEEFHRGRLGSGSTLASPPNPCNRPISL